MSVEIYQDNDVLVVVFTGAITQADIRVSANKFHALCSSSLTPIHVIADGRQITGFPPDILALLKTLVVPAYPSNTGTIIIITQNVVIEKIVMFLCHLLPTAAIQIVRSSEDAWMHVNELRHIEV